ncbi:type II toxin-antitoxin system VapB family antitoxin [Asticcacaulis benevestitus]|uniref:type II toxin-antitoxin system VapB family antitoxin n=1 Tax=Asticcacaulis benevestitus TaxID=347481 RepID=UPI002453F738|nr:type II toxin-antitoxin system VapB family antitoxin [Asticcacaulis benevestitus]
MTRTTLFQSNRSQAVRLPKDVAFPEGVKDVTILREGGRRIIVPSNSCYWKFG